jgi:hypothetical protein
MAWNSSIPFEHDDRAGFSVVSGPSTQSGEYPGGEGERAFRVGILLPFGFSFERLGDPLESGLIFEVKRILEGTPATSIALVNELKHGDCSNDTSEASPQTDESCRMRCT